MPELPEVETVKKGLESSIVNETIKKVYLSDFPLRFPLPDNFIKLVLGKTILSVQRRAKYIFIKMSNNYTIISHLGMSGSYKILTALESKNYIPSKHDHVVFEFEKFKVVYNDPRRFGYILITEDEPENHKLIKTLGPEPLSNRFNETFLAESFFNKERPIKSALLDQNIISGLGNIYVCEALFKAGINPRIKVKSLVSSNGSPKDDLRSLKDCINQVIKKSIGLGRLSLKNFSNTEGKMGYFQRIFSVYGREGENCLSKKCNKKIERIVQSGRSTFYCPNCQK